MSSNKPSQWILSIGTLILVLGAIFLLGKAWSNRNENDGDGAAPAPPPSSDIQGATAPLDALFRPWDAIFSTAQGDLVQPSDLSGQTIMLLFVSS